MIFIIWLYIALNRTPNIDCYWVGAVPKVKDIIPVMLHQMETHTRARTCFVVLFGLQKHREIEIEREREKDEQERRMFVRMFPYGLHEASFSDCIVYIHAPVATASEADLSQGTNIEERQLNLQVFEQQLACRHLRQEAHSTTRRLSQIRPPIEAT